MQEDMYTVMNPAGTLMGQNKAPAYEVPFAHHSMQNGCGVFQDQHSLTETNNIISMTVGCAAAAESAPATAGFVTQDEERYVKGAF